MEMMKKLAILIVAIILGGLGYAAYQRYTMQSSENVQIQSNSHNGLKYDGASCKHGSECMSHHCSIGTCGKK